MSKKKAPPQWRNRMVGTGEENPEQLLANPLNWRIHPKAQQDALSGVLDEVGWVQRVTVNRKTGFVVDGHLRVALAISRGESVVPVEYVDLTPAEEAEVLATLDPIGAMAAADAEKLDELLQDVQSGSAAVQEMIAEIAERSGVTSPDWEAAFSNLSTGDRAPFQQMTFTLHDQQAEIVKAALTRARQQGCESELNENSNGNALAYICEAYCGQG